MSVWQLNNGLWSVAVTHNKQRNYLGQYESKDEAIEKMNKFKKQNNLFKYENVDDTIRHMLFYDYRTGFIEYKSTGTRAGSKNGEGYLVIEISRKCYQAHRIAWFLHYNEWPENKIDHINGIRNDNRICNLRDVTDIENSRNIGLSSANTSGYPGVTRKNEKWQARIGIGGTRLHLGSFDTFEEAVSARKIKEQELGYSIRIPT